jgi:hypothetical protein
MKPIGKKNRNGYHAEWTLLLLLNEESVNTLLFAFQVVSELEDDVFEPNERIFVGNLVLKNIGELHCPEGAEVTFVGTTSVHSTTSVNFMPQKIRLPKVKLIIFTWSAEICQSLHASNDVHLGLMFCNRKA